jgi:hypothetical protein
MKLIYLKSALKSNSFYVSIGIKIPFFRVLVAIEPGRSLLTVRYHELIDKLWCMSLNLIHLSCGVGMKILNFLMLWLFGI